MGTAVHVSLYHARPKSASDYSDFCRSIRGSLTLPPDPMKRARGHRLFGCLRAHLCAPMFDGGVRTVRAR
jgi:hypothetical protein